MSLFYHVSLTSIMKTALKFDRSEVLGFWCKLLFVTNEFRRQNDGDQRLLSWQPPLVVHACVQQVSRPSVLQKNHIKKG